MEGEFSLTDFAINPSVEQLRALKKDELIAVAAHYEIVEVKRYMLKSDILRKIVEFLVEEEVLPSDAAENVRMTPPRSQSPVDSQARLSDNEVRIRELELERARVELERERLAAVNRNDRNDDDRRFDVAKYARMVPSFEEEGVEKYFPHFEKLALSMGWPKEMWAHLVQSKLSGKARDAYLAMPMADVSDYEKVKKAVLKAYELVPEAYRQRFRCAQKDDSQTHTEFAKDKEQLFDRWCSSVQAENYAQLREMILLEEFKRSVRQDVRLHLEEQRVETLDEAARIADDYVLTHKINNDAQKNEDRYVRGERSPFPSQKNTSNSTPEPRSRATDSDSKQSESEQKTRNVDGQFVCYYCRQPGHVKSSCPKLQKKKQENVSEFLAHIGILDVLSSMFSGDHLNRLYVLLL